MHPENQSRGNLSGELKNAIEFSYFYSFIYFFLSVLCSFSAYLLTASVPLVPFGYVC